MSRAASLAHCGRAPHRIASRDCVAVSLANVLSARSMKDRVTFVADDFQKLYKDLLPPAFEVQVRSLQ